MTQISCFFTDHQRFSCPVLGISSFSLWISSYGLDSAATERFKQAQTDHPKQMVVCLWDNLSLKVDYD